MAAWTERRKGERVMQLRPQVLYDREMKRATCLLLAAVLPVFATAAEFALRDGDTVVFLGESITAARQYSKVIESFTLLRFPERKIKFINAGRGGETAKGSLARLDKDVFGQGATVVTVAYGVNDIGWGVKADAAHKQDYLDAIGELVARCQKRGVRVFICSAAITAEDPDKAERSFLQKMCDEGLALAKGKGAGAIDVQRSMRAVQRRVLAANAKQSDKAKPVRLHVEDGVHLNDLGQMAMAFAILKGLGASADVSSATIDARQTTAVAAEGCQVLDVQRTPDGVTFARTDERLPLNLAPLWMLHGFYIPIGDELNRYLLTVKNLADGRYEVTAGGRLLGTWPADALARGINIASATADPWEPGGPWDAQAHAVKILTDMRDELAFARRGVEQNLTTHPQMESLRARATAIEESLVTLQREMARPVPVKFEVRRRVPDKTASPNGTLPKRP
jgi:lysophospholipase L1-like esterase